MNTPPPHRAGRLVAAVLASLALVGAAEAQPGRRDPNPFDGRGSQLDLPVPDQLERAARPLPAFQIVERLRRQIDGDLVGVLGLDDRGQAYRVRWREPNGQVVDLVVDAQTGQILRRMR